MSGFRAADIDAVIAARIRERRIKLCLTQQALAANLGCSYQQIHKYETGQNTYRASRLVMMLAAQGLTPDALLGDLVEAARARRAIEPPPHGDTQPG